MPHYSVEVTVGRLQVDVEAANPDAAVMAALTAWNEQDVLAGGTFDVHEIASDD